MIVPFASNPFLLTSNSIFSRGIFYTSPCKGRNSPVNVSVMGMPQFFKPSNSIPPTKVLKYVKPGVGVPNMDILSLLKSSPNGSGNPMGASHRVGLSHRETFPIENPFDGRISISRSFLEIIIRLTVDGSSFR